MSDQATSNLAAMKLVNESLLEQLECPVCLDVCKPPIFMCVNGHNICPGCKPQVRHCPVCRVPGPLTTRNIALEAVSVLVMLPCKFKKEGCRVEMRRSELEAHYAVCEFRSHCLIHGCTWLGNLTDLLPHLKKNHPFYEAGTNSTCKRVVSFNLDSGTWEPYLMSEFDNELFWFHYRYNVEESTFYFYCQYVGHKDAAKNYRFYITLFSPDGKISNSYVASVQSLDEDYKRNANTFVLSKLQGEKFLSTTGVLLLSRRLKKNKKN